MISTGKPLRVAAYCRVSTDRDDQANSFESQQRYFREYIARQPGWELAGIFADEGLSGTSTKKRLAFQRMIVCAHAGLLDLIVTKEISRFARNTLDSIYYTRELKRLGVGVLFLNDNLYTRRGRRTAADNPGLHRAGGEPPHLRARQMGAKAAHGTGRCVRTRPARL